MARVEIFTGPLCTYCEQTKALMDRHQVPFIEYDISDPTHMQEFMRRLPRVRSIPQIFVSGEHIGNDQDLEALIAAGYFNKN